MTRRNPTDSPKSYPITCRGSHLPDARWPRRLAVAAFLLALAMVGFAATVASLASLAVPSPATPTTITIPAGVSAGGGR
jgi:hypothetical protein